MSGAEIPIRKDDQPTTGNIISVGQTRLVPEDLRKRLMLGKKLIVANSMRDSFVVASREGSEAGTSVLFLLGHRPRSTVFAVYDFLESLGCRWFFACEAGECIPRRSRVAVEKRDSFKKPDFALRIHYTWGGPRTQETWKRERAWFEANKMSLERANKAGSGHNFTTIWPKELYEEHPEYFPLLKLEKKAALPNLEAGGKLLTDREDDALSVEEIGGKPLADKQDGGLALDEAAIDGPEKKDDGPVMEWRRAQGRHRCLSNPGVIQLGIEWADNLVTEHPDYDMVPFIQSDGYTHCQCEECRKLGHFGDQNIYLANQVGKVFFKKHPDKMIHIISYFESARIPHRKIDGYDQNKDRVWVTLLSNFAKVPFDKLIEGWSKASHHLEVTDAFHFFSGEITRPSATWPRAFVARLQRYPFFKKHNVAAVNAVLKSEWACYGLARYLSAKLMWDANADVEALKQEFYSRMFPNATADFQEFISLYGTVGKIEMQGFLRRGFSCLDRIGKKLQTAEERKRWEFYALYLHELVLEASLSKAKTPYERLMIIRRIVSFLRAIEDRGVLESSQRIGMIHLPRLQKLKWAKFSGPNAPKVAQPDATKDPTEEDRGMEVELKVDESEEPDDKPDPFDKTLNWYQKRQAILKDIPVLDLDSKRIDELFNEDLSKLERRAGEGK